MLGSGTILNEVIKAQKKFLMKNIMYLQMSGVLQVIKNCTRMQLKLKESTCLTLEKEQIKPYISKVLENETSVFISASDYIKALPALIEKVDSGEFHFLGTDGFGRSDGREQLRFFLRLITDILLLLHSVLFQRKRK